MFATEYFEDETCDGEGCNDEECISTKIHFVGLLVEYDHILPTVEINHKGDIYYKLANDGGGFSEEESIRTDIDAALLRLERECAAIKSFHGQIRTKEQRKIVEILGLRHTGKKIVIENNNECYGLLYSKNAEVCNLHCGLMKQCIHSTKILRKRIENVFPTMSRTIFKLMKEIMDSDER
ncbi:MAG: hypothetical protein ACTSW7_00990 [Candidatus Thorarchaeota archaeon]|nr:MAG: hypothetical protein DRQ25_04805 [Candidatus Fermentibacteria bacterium]HEC72048.1 hypothetical protein [Thermoplasmatales archaeon]